VCYAAKAQGGGNTETAQAKESAPTHGFTSREEKGSNQKRVMTCGASPKGGKKKLTVPLSGGNKPQRERDSAMKIIRETEESDMEDRREWKTLKKVGRLERAKPSPRWGVPRRQQPEGLSAHKKWETTE